jgi:hypothetical protein
MRLKNATGLAIIAICYLFLSKTAATFFTDIFRHLTVAKVTILFATLSSLAIVYFYYCFLKYYVRREQTTFKNLCALAVVASVAMALLYIKGFLQIYDVYMSAFLVRSFGVEAIVTWASALIGLAFFVGFYNEVQRSGESPLKKPILFAIVGSAIGVLERTLILYVSLHSKEVMWFSDLAKSAQYVLLPVIGLGVLAILYFFVSFYRLQSRYEGA